MVSSSGIWQSGSQIRHACSHHSTRRLKAPQPRLKESPAATLLQGERGFSIRQWLREGNILEIDSTCMHISTASHIHVYQGCHTLRFDAAMDPHQTQVTLDVLCTLSCSFPSSLVQPHYYPNSLNPEISSSAKRLPTWTRAAPLSSFPEQSFPASQMHLPLPLRSCDDVASTPPGNRLALKPSNCLSFTEPRDHFQVMSLYTCDEGNARGTSTKVVPPPVPVRRLLAIRLSTLSRLLYEET